MKLNWGTIMVIVMTAFIVFIVTMGIRMSASDSELYEDDYYEQGEDHDSRHAMELNADKVKIFYKAEELTISVKYDSVGTYKSMMFRNLSDKSKDFMVRGDTLMHSDQTLDIQNLDQGVWMVECEGEVNGLSFFKKMEFIR